MTDMSEALTKHTTNDIKKGDRVLLRCGWYGTMMDNTRQNTRVVDVEGDFREMGSVYAHDIIEFQKQGVGTWYYVTHTPKQLEMRKMVEGLYASLR